MEHDDWNIGLAFEKYTAGPAGSLSISFSADGKRIVTCCKNKVYVWNAATGKHWCEPLEIDTNVRIMCACFSPVNNNLIVYGTGWANRDEWNSVRFWDIERSSNNELPTLHGHESAVRCVDWSGDGTMIASGSWDGTVRTWEVMDNYAQQIFRHKEMDMFVEYVSFSDDSKRVISSTGQVIYVWDISGDLLLRMVNTMSRRMYQNFSVSYFGDRVVSFDSVPKGKEVVTNLRVWDVKTGKN